VCCRIRSAITWMNWAVPHRVWRTSRPAIPRSVARMVRVRRLGVGRPRRSATLRCGIARVVRVFRLGVRRPRRLALTLRGLPLEGKDIGHDC
jgi:hypothetical protein